MAKRPIFEKKNVLVTGGAGFIGSHLCDALIKDNRVICLDNFLTSKEENINHLLINPDFEFIRHDLNEPINLEELKELKEFKIPFQGIQEIYHLACPASPKDYEKYPIETLIANAYATRNALELARKYQSKFIFTSSSTVYGEAIDPKNVQISEKYWGYLDPIGEKSCYDEGKRFAEAMVMNYMRYFRLETKIARVWNTYGPRMRLYDGRLVPDIISQAINQEPIEVSGDIDKITSFCYIEDMVEGLMKLAKSKFAGPINLGNPDGAKLRDVIQKIISLSGSNSKVAVKPESGLRYSIKQSLPDIFLAKEKLGWFPMTNLDKGLFKTIEYMKGLKVVSLENLNI